MTLRNLVALLLRDDFQTKKSVGHSCAYADEVNVFHATSLCLLKR